jgi:hypothetical protein
MAALVRILVPDVRALRLLAIELMLSLSSA